MNTFSSSIAITFLLLCLPLLTGAHASRERAILEVYQSSAGMVAIPGRYLYVRVGGDRVVEYDEPEITDLGLKINKKSYTLTENKFDALKGLLNQLLEENMPSKFEPDAAALDHLISLDIRIDVDSRQKSLTLLNFSPRLSKEPDKYPKSVVELECTLSVLRTQSDHRMLANDCLPRRSFN